MVYNIYLSNEEAMNIRYSILSNDLSYRVGYSYNTIDPPRMITLLNDLSEIIADDCHKLRDNSWCTMNIGLTTLLNDI